MTTTTKKTETKKKKRTKKKLTIEEKMAFVAETYPKVWSAMETLGLAMNKCAAKDIRMVSGLVGKMAASKSAAAKEIRLAENKKKKAARVEASLAAAKARTVELEKLRDELAADVS